MRKLIILLLAMPFATNADPILIGEFGGDGVIQLSLNANGTISASAESFSGNIIGVGIDAGFTSAVAPEYDFSPVDPVSNGGNLAGWSTSEGLFLLGFACGNNNGVLCTSSISWTIGSIGQFSSASDIIGGTDSVHDLFLLTEFGSQLYALAEEVSVPEPGTLALLGIGLLGMGMARRKTV